MRSIQNHVRRLTWPHPREYNSDGQTQTPLEADASLLQRLRRTGELDIAKEPPSNKDLFLGIDLGGTKIIAGLVDRGGRIVARQHRTTQAREGQDAVVRRLMDATTHLLTAEGVDRAAVIAVGVAAPGPIDARLGVVTAPPNLPGWRDVPGGGY